MEFKPFKENDDSVTVISTDRVGEQANYISKVYAWMSGGLALTGLFAYWVAANPSWVMTLASNRILFFGLMIAELGLVVYLTARIQKMSYSSAVTSYLIYAILNGVTLSMIFVAFTFSSIARTFFITAGTFAIMSIYGYTTKKDLTGIGRILFMLLIGVILASIVNFFMHSETLHWIISYVGVAIFVGLIAYDTQKIKRYFAESQDDEETMKKISIMGALALYLDFINLFLFLLRFFGNRN